MDITPMLIQQYRNHRLSTVSRHKRLGKASTVKSEIATPSAVLNAAIDNDLLGLNPCRKIKWGKGQAVSQRERILTKAEEAELMRELEQFPESRAAVLIALNTGMRRMEILNSKASDLDPQSRTLRYKAKGGKDRVIPLNNVSWNVITEPARRPTLEGFLFHRRTGHNLSAGQGAFKLAAQRAKIKDLNFHDLRHTFSTRVRAYTDLFTVRDLTGRSETKTTDIYAATPPEDMRAAVDALARRGKVSQSGAKTG